MGADEDRIVAVPASTIDLSRVVRRQPFATGGVVSGSTFESATLDDGRQVVLKHLPSGGDWLTRVTHGLGRIKALWDDGLLERVADVVDHAVLDVVRADDHDVVVMEDVSPSMLRRGRRLTDNEVDAILAGLAQLHSDLEGTECRALCTPADRHRLAAPSFHRTDSGPNPCPFGKILVRGWERFGDQAPADVASAIFAVLGDDLDRYGRELELAAHPTLLHGDVKLGNIGLRGRRLVLIDWSELSGIGPGEMDLTWFAATATCAMPGAGTWAFDGMPDDLFRAYEAHAGRRLDPRALDLACIGQLAQQGFLLASVAASDRESAPALRAAQMLDWWVSRVRQSLETWSP